MKTKVLVAAAAVAWSLTDGYAQGTVWFQGFLVSNILTQARVPAGDQFWVALYWLPDSARAPSSSDFDAAGPAAIAAVANFWADGVFRAGVVQIDGIQPPGGYAWFQVRAWEHFYGTNEVNSYAEAMCMPVDPAVGRAILAGTSNIFRLDTGDPTQMPPEAPPSLAGPGRMQSFYVVPVQDAEPPRILRRPANRMIAVGPACQAEVPNLLPEVVATDNCTPDNELIFLQTPPPGSVIGLGTRPVTITVLDKSSNTATCTVQVTGWDTEPPLLACPSDVVTNVASGACDQMVKFTVEANDNCAYVTVSCQPPSGTTFPKGTTAVHCSATDRLGNTASCTFTVTVRDPAPPSLTCPADIVVEFSDETGAVAWFEVTAADTCSEFVLEVWPPPGSLFPIGMTAVHAQATDAEGNSASCTFNLTVLGPLGVKEKVRSELAALRSSVTAQEDADKLDEAIRLLSQSLEPGAWLDQTHLARKHGDKVFHAEKEAVKKLKELLLSENSQLADALVQSLIGRIVRADRLVALISIQEAAAAGVNPKKIAEELKELEKGDQQVAEGGPEKAIEHYRHAWKHAVHLKVKPPRGTPSGPVQLQFLGLPGETYLIQASTNLTDWTTIGTCKADAQGNVQFLDPDASGQPAKFYRVTEPWIP